MDTIFRDCCFVLFYFTTLILGQEVRFRDEASSITEGGNRRSVEVCLEVLNRGAIVGTATVTVMSQDQTANSGTDFTPALSQELSFTTQQKQAPCFTFTSLQDTAVEDIEFFNVVLTNPTGITTATPSQASVTINDDNDVISVDFTSLTYTATESAGANICLRVLSGSVQRNRPVEVTLIASPGTATGPEDYTVPLPIQVINGVMTGQTACRTIALNDRVIESQESFTLSLSATLFQPVTVSNNTTTVVIDDDDMARFSISPQSVTETNTQTNLGIVVVLQVSSPLARDVIVKFSTADGTATAGSDYQTVSADLTFIRGTANGVGMKVQVPIIGDEDGEMEEYFIVSLTPATPDTPTSVNIIIVNDDRDCPDLLNPANGMVQMSGFSKGSTAIYSCNTGYTLAGNTTRTCGNMKWTGSEPVCQVDCPSLSAPTAGSVNVSSRSQGSTATYSCNNGYTLVGDMTRNCGNTAAWTGSEPVCQPVDCGTAPSLANGGVTSASNVFGAVATYTCNSGYRLASPQNTRMCMNNGQWSNQNIQCEQVDCGTPPGIDNGSVQSSSTVFGGVANYTCDTGYRLASGDSQRICMSNGEWSNEDIKCQTQPGQADCGPPPKLENGRRQYEETSIGAKATYTCNDGYQLTTSISQRECLLQAKWSNENITCQADCGPPPKLENGRRQYEETSIGATATYTCNDGYQLTTSISQIECLLQAKWSNENITCESLSATPATNENDSDGLKGGEIAGIVIAVVFVVVVALVLAVVLAVFLWKRNSSYRQSNKKWIEVTDNEPRVVSLVGGSPAELQTSYEEAGSPVDSQSSDSEAGNHRESQLDGVDVPTEMSTFAAL